ncbi:MAG: MiaB/RimO family radical SAM methylthiotransferase [Bacteroidetes bacterium]|nr:MiaB/RimO family radical SAM methylthiotransferase [Bacteroidota bacterium]
MDQPQTIIKRKLYLESYGCAMNFADSEVVASIMAGEGFDLTNDINEADAVFLNTCAVRENAEQTVWNRLHQIKHNEKKRKPSLVVGVLGCMAERLKKELMDREQMVDLIIGPDAYRDIPKLLLEVGDGQRAMNIILSKEETYAEIAPVKLDENGISSYVSIMRGCDNMCAFCVVPFTRGRERSRDPFSIVSECIQLEKMGYREIMLLGQNVDSYKWSNISNTKKEVERLERQGVFNNQFKTEATINLIKELDAEIEKQTAKEDREETVIASGDELMVSFDKLLEMVAKAVPNCRIRFCSSHPKDITDEVLYTMARYENICNYIHYPLQSGSSRVLELMNRTYSAEWFLKRLARIREILPDCGISTDVIAGFCTETEEELNETIALMREAKFDFAYMYFYSERPGTLAARQYPDDVPLEVKKRRLQSIIDMQSEVSKKKNEARIGNTYKVLIEGESKRSGNDLRGRNDGNVVCVFPKKGEVKKGDYVNVKIIRSTQTSLIGEIVE